MIIKNRVRAFVLLAALFLFILGGNYAYVGAGILVLSGLVNSFGLSRLRKYLRENPRSYTETSYYAEKIKEKICFSSDSPKYVPLVSTRGCVYDTYDINPDRFLDSFK